MKERNERHEPRTWDELISNVVVVSEGDKVQHHTGNDFDLGPSWLFAGGRTIDRKWMTAWVQITPEIREEVEPYIIQRIGSAQPLKLSTGAWRMIFSSSVYIGSEIVEMIGTPPEKLQQFFAKANERSRRRGLA